MVAYVAALYRYPLKSGTPEARESLEVLPDGRIAGDRVLALKFADNEAPGDEWSPKQSMLVLMNTPGLARLQVRYDEKELRLRIALDGKALADEPLTLQGRVRIAEAMAAYALTLDVNPLTDHPERLPLRLVGDGVTPRYFDASEERGPEVTMHSRESLRSLGGALNAEGFDERRFRSNIAIDGTLPWEDLDALGKTVRVGSVEFRVPRQKQRCLATHANPATGVRDLQVLTTLTHAFGQEQPTFAVAMVCQNSPGTIRVSDPVEIL
jgi:uncharacterized protein YcbX